MFGNLGTTEILLIAVGIIVLFGAKKIPALAKGIGQGIRDFKREVRNDNKYSKEK
jgi:sec-independent protein translocase protein TatA